MVFDLCGVRTLYRTMYRVIATRMLEQRLAWLEDAACIPHALHACVSHIFETEMKRICCITVHYLLRWSRRYA